MRLSQYPVNTMKETPAEAEVVSHQLMLRASLIRRLAETSGGPGTVGRAILQDIREFSAGHVQVDDITLVCFGPVPKEGSGTH